MHCVDKPASIEKNDQIMWIPFNIKTDGLLIAKLSEPKHQTKVYHCKR